MSQFNSSRRFGRRYFSRSPWSSYHFWVTTFFFLLVASLGLYYAIRFSERLNVETTLMIVFPSVVMAVLWFRIWTAHRDVYDALRNSSDGQVGGSSEGNDTTVNVLLDNLAYMSYAGFALGLFAVGSTYVAMAQSIAVASNH